ncbi:tetratricopeptide repeat protein [Scopulibacillus darangshiensis]|uniref:Tetratricopeptide repeat protein n=1 Tax=Scopulibacillus darangshiensis TaxID=442528 RepID=A0A4R2NQ27_9BACL|nr:tetratricopeptide repeat protein [Scopulibacillus darangshiensis]TCP23782.1 tetratricopeptide repeat protein [Scopulibacillus darangshiensis]
MTTKAVSCESVSKVLGLWHNALIRNQLNEAIQYKDDVENIIMDMEQDQTILLYYSLLVLRHNLLTNNAETPNQYLKSIKPFEEKMGSLLTYYYHLFTGMHKSAERRYGEALDHYTAAEEKLIDIPDDMEKGEFHYRVASVYYHIRQTMLAYKHVKQAKAIFDTDKDYGKKSADCDNLLGLCYILNKNFGLAEKHLRQAFETAELFKDEELKLHIYYNLGFLYAEKKEPDHAIDYLNKVHAAGFNKVRTPFLLAREYFKIAKSDKAFEMIDKGLKVCEETNNVEYRHHYSILRAFNDGSSDDEIESAVKEGMTYFKKHRLNGYVNDYSSQLAYYFCERENHEKASRYFRSAYESRETEGLFIS